MLVHIINVKCSLTTPSLLLLYTSLISHYKPANCNISDSRKPSFCNVRGTIFSGIMFYSFAIAITDVCDITVRRIWQHCA